MPLRRSQILQIRDSPAAKRQEGQATSQRWRFYGRRHQRSDHQDYWRGWIAERRRSGLSQCRSLQGGSNIRRCKMSFQTKATLRRIQMPVRQGLSGSLDWRFGSFVVHTRGTRNMSRSVGSPYFTGFSAFRSSVAESPTLSAINRQKRCQTQSLASVRPDATCRTLCVGAPIS
jgi:hypothetical protein